MKEGSGFFLPVKALYDDAHQTELWPDLPTCSNIPEASLSIYDNLVSDSVIVQMVAADV